MPLSYSEIAAWERLSCRRLEPWMVDAIRVLDGVYFKTTTKPQ